jgi:hypothetical protein
VELKLLSLHIPILDWTTSFLSDVFIIGLTLKTVKLFLKGYKGRYAVATEAATYRRKSPAMVARLDEDRKEATAHQLKNVTRSTLQSAIGTPLTKRL